jgi:rubrerythrin
MSEEIEMKSERAIKLDEREKYLNWRSVDQKEFEFIVNRFYEKATPEEIEQVESTVRILDENKKKFNEFLPKFQKKSEEFMNDLGNLIEGYAKLIEDYKKIFNYHLEDTHKPIDNPFESIQKVATYQNNKIEKMGGKIDGAYEGVGQLLHGFRPKSERKSYSPPWQGNLDMENNIAKGYSRILQTLSESLKNVKYGGGVEK